MVYKGFLFMDRVKTSTLSGAEIVIRCLQEEGVEYVFGYPGGAVLFIYDELFKQDKVKHVLVRVVADLGGTQGRLFRTFMDNRNWFHPFNAEGHRRDLSDIPRHVKALTDDPYRSLAGELRRALGVRDAGQVRLDLVVAELGQLGLRHAEGVDAHHRAQRDDGGVVLHVLPLPREHGARRDDADGGDDVGDRGDRGAAPQQRLGEHDEHRGSGDRDER